jgi:hypothetical protein
LGHAQHIDADFMMGYNTRVLCPALSDALSDALPAVCCLRCRCCGLERAPAAVDATLVAICYLAASPKLQAMLLQSGALSVLIPLLLQYDVTLSPEASARLQLPFTTAGAAAGGAGEGQHGSSPDASGLRLLDMALVRPNMQEARSQHALLAAHALARLAGLLVMCGEGIVHVDLKQKRCSSG